MASWFGIQNFSPNHVPGEHPLPFMAELHGANKWGGDPHHWDEPHVDVPVTRLVAPDTPGVTPTTEGANHR